MHGCTSDTGSNNEAVTHGPSKKPGYLLLRLVGRTFTSQALRRAALMTEERFKGVRMKFKTNELTLAVENTQGESVSEMIGIDYEGEEIDLGMNVAFLADAVDNVTGDTVTLGLRSGLDSILITQEKNPNFRGVVMPMRV